MVIENLSQRFISEINNFEGEAFYAYQNGNEAIHAETYSLMINTYIENEEEQRKLFNAIEEIEVIKEKAEWARKWTSSNSTLNQRILAFAIVEGVFFSGSFCSIYWLKKRGLMPGLSLSNDLISRDEALHTLHAVLQYNKVGKRLSKEVVHNMIKGAVLLEEKFVSDALKFKLRGMNKELMIQYVKYVADRLCDMLEYEKIYNVENPFDFIELLSLETRENFFEQRNGQYQRWGIMSNDLIKEMNKKFFHYENVSKVTSKLNNDDKNDGLNNNNNLSELLLEFGKDHDISSNVILEWINNKNENNNSKYNKLELDDDF